MYETTLQLYMYMYVHRPRCMKQHCAGWALPNAVVYGATHGYTYMYLVGLVFGVIGGFITPAFSFILS